MCARSCGGGVALPLMHMRKLFPAIAALAAVSMLLSLAAPPAGAKPDRPNPKSGNVYSLSLISCSPQASRYQCLVQFFDGNRPVQDLPVFVAVTQQRLVGAKGADGEAWTRVSKPATKVFTGITDSSGRFMFEPPKTVMTCIKNRAEDDPQVTTDEMPDGSSADGKRCQNKNMHLRNARYHISWWVDRCWRTCPPAYYVKANAGKALSNHSVQGNKGVPHQWSWKSRRSPENPRGWVMRFKNPHYGQL